MHLIMWHKGGNHIHASGKGGKQNAIDNTCDRLMFYDQSGSIVYDQMTGTWYQNGQPFTPTFPVTFTLEDGRKVTADLKGGKLKWQIQ